MFFESLQASAQRGELILVENGYCRYHLRRDGQLTIYEIISLQPGTGTHMLNMLKEVPGATSIFAKCPADLPSNAWYQRRGFVCEGEEITRTGRKLRLWRLRLEKKI